MYMHQEGFRCALQGDTSPLMGWARCRSRTRCRPFPEKVFARFRAGCDHVDEDLREVEELRGEHRIHHQPRQREPPPPACGTASGRVGMGAAKVSLTLKLSLD